MGVAPQLVGLGMGLLTLLLSLDPSGAWGILPAGFGSGAQAEFAWFFLVSASALLVGRAFESILPGRLDRGAGLLLRLKGSGLGPAPALGASAACLIAHAEGLSLCAVRRRSHAFYAAFAVRSRYKLMAKLGPRAS